MVLDHRLFSLLILLDSNKQKVDQQKSFDNAEPIRIHLKIDKKITEINVYFNEREKPIPVGR